jgi:hypothetical protein
VATIGNACGISDLPVAFARDITDGFLKIALIDENEIY